MKARQNPTRRGESGSVRADRSEMSIRLCRCVLISIACGFVACSPRVGSDAAADPFSPRPIASDGMRPADMQTSEPSIVSYHAEPEARSIPASLAPLAKTNPSSDSMTPELRDQASDDARLAELWKSRSGSVSPDFALGPG